MALYEPYYKSPTTTAGNARLEIWEIPPGSAVPEPNGTYFGQPLVAKVGPDYRMVLARIATALERVVGRPRDMRICYICKVQGKREGFSLGYGSEYDGEWICEDCLHLIVDKAIKEREA